MKTWAFVLVLCLALAGCGAKGSSRGISSNMSPKEVELRLNLVESHINSEQYQLALQELLKVEPAAKNLPRFHYDSGMIYRGLRELEKSREGFVRAVELDEEYGEAWKVAPQIVRIPSGHDAPDFSTVVWLRPQGYRAPPRDVDPAAITSAPAWAGLSLVPAGRPAARGIPMRLSVAAGVLRFWTRPKTLHVAIPGHGTAALRLEMIPADGSGHPPSGGEECCDE